MTATASIEQLVQQLELGDGDAQREIWDRYFARLIQAARSKLAARYRRAADEEDLALSALNSLYAMAERGCFDEIGSRDDLWRVLLMLVSRKACDLVERERRQKRGGGRVRGDSAFGAGEEGRPEAGFDGFAGSEVPPDLALLFAEEVDARLDSLEPPLREYALLKMRGFTNREIAEAQQVSLATVERKLARIRSCWTERDRPEVP